MGPYVSERLSSRQYKSYRLDAIFSGNKWDPQVRDQPSIADRAIVLGIQAWMELRTASEALFAETLRIEDRLSTAVQESRAVRFLPRRAWERLKILTGHETPPAVRLMRFDFHPTSTGWMLSEVNSDVPGGLNEASRFHGLWPRRDGRWRPPGDPAQAYVDRVVSQYTLDRDSLVGLIHATAYSDDWQQMAYLQDLLEAGGIESLGVAPTNVELAGNCMRLAGRRLDMALRFFPGDWLLFSRWGEPWFEHGTVQVSNPLRALLSQNKHFPVSCAQLGIQEPTWTTYLPPTTALRGPDLVGSDGLIKPCFGRIGEGIKMLTDLTLKERLTVVADLILGRGVWVKQVPFIPSNLGSDVEPINACLGVYVLDGQVVGCYGRMTSEKVIGIDAADAPVFIED